MAAATTTNAARVVWLNNGERKTMCVCKVSAVWWLEKMYIVVVVSSLNYFFFFFYRLGSELLGLILYND